VLTFRTSTEYPLLPTTYRLEGDVVAAKWLLWNGRKERCFEELEALRRETGCQKIGAPELGMFHRIDDDEASQLVATCHGPLRRRLNKPRRMGLPVNSLDR